MGLDHKDPLEILDHKELMDVMVLQERADLKVTLGHQENKVLLEMMATTGILVRKETEGQRETQAHKDQQVHKVFLDQMEPEDRKEIMVNQGLKAVKVFKVLLVHEESLENKDHQVM